MRLLSLLLILSFFPLMRSLLSISRLASNLHLLRQRSPSATGFEALALTITSSYQRLLATAAATDVILTADQSTVAQNRRKKVQKVADMDEFSAREELKRLNEEICCHDRLYYSEAKPVISDAAYDRLVKRAQTIVGKFTYLSPLVEKLSTVGYNVGEGSSSLHCENSHCRHALSMMSLDNTFLESELAAFLWKTDSKVIPFLSLKASSSAINSTQVDETDPTYVVEPKIDGVSLSLHYKNGELAQALTRGNGQVGEDITTTVRRFLTTRTDAIYTDSTRTMIPA